jgi:hypothetical protein
MAMTFLAESSPLHSLNDPLELQCYSGLSPESTTERARSLSRAYFLTANQTLQESAVADPLVSWVIYRVITQTIFWMSGNS